MSAMAVPLGAPPPPTAEQLDRYRTFLRSGDWSGWTPKDLWPTKGAQACDWIRANCVFGEGERFGEPAELLAEWELVLHEWFEFRPSPRGECIDWRYKEALFGFPKGCGKTQVLAWLAEVCTFGPPPIAPRSALTRIAAASYDQAAELFAGCQVCSGGQDNIYAEFPLSGLFLVQDGQIIRKDGVPGKIQRIAAAAGTTDGAKPTLFIADELHEWNGNKARVHLVNSNGVAKRKDARELNISTAGVAGSIPPKPTDGLLWKMYLKGLDAIAHPDKFPRFLFRWFGVEADSFDPDDDAQLEHAIRRSAGTACDNLFNLHDRVAKFRDPKVPRNDALRYFTNSWVATADDWWLAAAPQAWDSCAAPLVIPDGAPIVVGLDGALRNDSMAVTVVHPTADGRKVWRSKVWTAGASGAIDHLAVKAHIVDLAAKYRLLALVYDPRLVQLMAQELEQEHGIVAIEVPQSSQRRGRMDAYAFAQIVDGIVAHPDDPILTSHVRAAVWRESEQGRVLSKSRSGGHIDALIAGVMATWFADSDEIPQPDAPRPDPEIVVVDLDGLTLDELIAMEANA